LGVGSRVPDAPRFTGGKPWRGWEMEDFSRALNMSVGMVIGAGSMWAMDRYWGLDFGRCMFEVVLAGVLTTGWAVWKAMRSEEGSPAVKP
jgi:hypothetical protein